MFRTDKMKVNPFIITYGEKILDLSSRTYIMGIVNVTPDSFSDGGIFFSHEKAVEHALRLIDEGADILDIGGESSRPGAETISVEEELLRVIPVIQSIRKESDVCISIDTMKSEVAQEALTQGANIINDISALQYDEKMKDVASDTKAPVILMHMLGTPKTMQLRPMYEDVISDIFTFFKDRLDYARRYGIEHVMIDPGIGFGKTVSHNLTLLKNLSTFKALGVPIVVGTSRKSFIGKLTQKEVDDRLGGTIASSVFGIVHGANIIRVHDVREMKNASLVADALLSPEGI